MIVGKNGSGKSTFFKLISGILDPSKGILNCRANVGMVFQNRSSNLIQIVEVNFLLTSIKKLVILKLVNK